MARKTIRVGVAIPSLVAAAAMSAALADDTEIFLCRYDATGVSGGRAKVLLIIDNSGSMRDEIASAKPAFDPNENYLDRAYTSLDRGSDLNRLRADRVYWSCTDPGRDECGKPPPPDSDQWLPADTNHCAAAHASLSAIGAYSDYVAAWQDGRGRQDGTWYVVSDHWTSHTADAWECQKDVDDDNDDNLGHRSGFPCASDPACRNPGGPWDGDGLRDYPHTLRNLYSARYMAWHHNGGMAQGRKKLDIAKEVLTKLVKSNPNVDFGLMTFNSNGTPSWSSSTWQEGRDGGRVIRHLAHMDEADRDALVDIIDSLDHETNTPLCETFYEAYRYIAKPDGIAQSVYFGDDDYDMTHGPHRYPKSSPARDACAENSSGRCSRDGTYESPLGDCEQMYILLMTDGIPAMDQSANSAVKAVTGVSSCGRYENSVHRGGDDWEVSMAENCLPELAEHMFTHDLDDQWENGDNIAVTFTVGFDIDQTLLSDTARRGGGKYFTADDATELNAAFQKTVNEILSSNTNFAAPAVAVDAFNRTRSLDDLFYSMFRPYNTPRWPGNIKKLIINDDGEVLDRNGARAIDQESGNIKSSAATFWTSAGRDGMDVESGGAGALLAARSVDSRTLYVNTGRTNPGQGNGTTRNPTLGEALTPFDTDNDALTPELFGVEDDDERDLLIDWARGVDVDDEDEDGDTADTRPWIIGDLIHSRPLAINYGGSDENDQDVRIVFGTNAGFLHMIDAADGSEDWAFFAKETAPIVEVLYENSITSEHPYGIDGSIGVYLLDANDDGSIVDGDGDKAYIFFGLRRGGTSYYALDVTDPDNPAMLWRRDEGFLDELGQTWAEPEVTHIPGYDGPVVIIGAGYDTNKDFHQVGSADSMGRGLYILDAETGARLWSATPGVSNANNLNVPGLEDSVPAAVTAIDSNSDGISDRIYFADTGANVWRIDMVGRKDQDWTAHKLAELGGDTESSDRRIFNRVDVVATQYKGRAFDAVIVGTGNRSHPLETTVENRFYMLRDDHIQSAIHVPNDGNEARNACEGPGANPHRLPCAEARPAITEADLLDVTDNLIQDGTDEQRAAARQALQAPDTRGWYLRLENPGEKALARSITLKGTVFFTSYVPPNPDDADSESICRPSEGSGYLYAMGLHDGSARYEWGASESAGLSKVDRRKKIKASIPDHAVAHFGTEIRLVGVGAGTDGKGSEDTGQRLSTDRVYWYATDSAAGF
ncbi:MAG: hypothetical protein K9L70_06145 [Thiohalocapsa sp.]|nr:hypothetical protein [Thiohalocapsa sp.]